MEGAGGVAGTLQPFRVLPVSSNYVNLDSGPAARVRWSGLDTVGGCMPGDPSMKLSIAFVSSLPAEHYHQLEALLFFNEGQSRVRHGIVTAINRYGPPEIAVEGKSLRVRVAGPSEAQCLFAVEREGKTTRPVGLILYIRDSFERITVLHLVVAKAYAAGGPRARYNLLLRLVQAVKRVARRTSGIRHVELLYSQTRPRAVYA